MAAMWPREKLTIRCSVGTHTIAIEDPAHRIGLEDLIVFLKKIFVLRYLQYTQVSGLEENENQRESESKSEIAS